MIVGFRMKNKTTMMKITKQVYKFNYELKNSK